MDDTVVFESFLVELFNDFSYDRKIDIYDIIDKLISQNKLSCKIKYEKYDSAINHVAAKYIIDYQNTIYKIAANALYNGSIKKLSKKEKELLEVRFTISPGCTEVILENSKEFLQNIKELIKVFPEKHRLPAFISLLGAVCFISTLVTYHNSNELDTEVAKVQYDKETKDRLSDSLDRAIDHLADVSRSNYNTFKEYEKNILIDLSSIDDAITINNQEKLSSQRIKEIKNLRFPKEEDRKEIKSIVGYFRITNIGLINHTITILETGTGNKMTVSYKNPEEALFAKVDINAIKKEISESVLKESKAYKMTIIKVIKNGKLDTAILDNIEDFELTPPEKV